ncbi:MAG: hypothetical protein U1E27_11465 [Kiritimatiellia bacterium]|nr:hypothetical protein [Kiritimatiellia bacterium]
MKRNGGWRWAGLALILVAGCARKYWEPSQEQMQKAEAVAKFYALQSLSDQAGTPAIKDLVFSPDGPPVNYPIAFTFGGTPYVRYQQKFWGGLNQGTRLIHVMYFDPNRIRNWEAEEATGEFPAHFSIAVDIDALTVAESTPPARVFAAPGE